MENSGQEVMSYVKIKIEFTTVSDNFDFLETVQNKTRSTSLPAVLNKKDPKHGEWSQKLTSPLSLFVIGDRFHTKRNSVLEDSFLKA
jgi:hypothetical protein